MDDCSGATYRAIAPVGLHGGAAPGRSMLDNHRIAACAAYVIDRTRRIIESCGPRRAGSRGERGAQEFMRAELAACCDGDVLLETFPVAHNAFFAMHAVAASSLLVAILLWHVHPALSLALDAAAVAIWYFQLVRYRRFLDPFFPKSESCNVYGRVKPAGELKRRIILSGHADAACEWRYAHLLPILLPAIVIGLLGGIAGVVILHLLGFAAWAAGGAFSNIAAWLGSLPFILIPGVAMGILFNNMAVIVPGANDNLSGALTAVGIAKQLKEAGIRLKNTELAIAIMGAEEAGLRGAKHFAARHKAECADVDTIVIVVDTFRDLDHMRVFNRDMNGTVRHDAGVCRLIQEAGAQCGVDIPPASIFLGSSDASAFTQSGWRAATFGAMDPRPADYYHTRRDTWDNMSEECLRTAIAVLCKALEMYDKQSSIPGAQEK